MATSGRPVEPRSIERRGLRDHVYDSLLDLLLSNDLYPGERLGIDALAAQLDVSPTPVREALVQLERTGLVTREALKGYRVSQPLSTRQMQDLLDVREMLEVQATRWSVVAMAEMLPELRRAHARHEEATAEVLARPVTEPVDLHTYREYFVADEAFHRVIFHAAGNHFLDQLVADLGAHQHRMRQTVVHGEYDVVQALAEHAAILGAVQRQDADAVVAAMSAHMAGIRRRSTTPPRAATAPTDRRQFHLPRTDRK